MNLLKIDEMRGASEKRKSDSKPIVTEVRSAATKQVAILSRFI